MMPCGHSFVVFRHSHQVRRHTQLCGRSSGSKCGPLLLRPSNLLKESQVALTTGSSLLILGRLLMFVNRGVDVGPWLQEQSGQAPQAAFLFLCAQSRKCDCDLHRLFIAAISPVAHAVIGSTFRVRRIKLLLDFCAQKRDN